MKKIAIVATILLFVCSIPTSLHAQTFRSRSSGHQTRRQSTSKNESQKTRRTIELRVLIDQKSAIGTSHEWMQALEKVGADRVVAETSRVKKPSFKEYGQGSIRTLEVIGIVKQGMLHLPGGKFRIGQTTAIKSHLKKLRDDGAEITVAEKVAFGLTAKQLLSVHDSLGATINSSTKGQDAAALAQRLLKQTGYEFKMDLLSREQLASSDAKVDIELNGYSLGTSLALTLRTMGLVFEPNRPQGEKIRLLVRVADEKQKNWPVGWPVSETMNVAAPKLRVRVPVQARDTQILKLLGAIESRVEIPFFYDTKKIQTKGVDLENTKVTYVREKKSSYDYVIGKVLNQCKPKLKFDLRIDEVGKRFLWITPR